jgi:flagellar basal body rod protein FlgG
MSSLTEIGRSALDALGRKLEVTANNIANADTPGFKRSRAILEEANPAGVVVSIHKVDSPGGPLPATDPSAAEQESSNVSLEEEIIDLITTKRAFEANTKPLKAEDEMVGSLLDSLG